VLSFAARDVEAKSPDDFVLDQVGIDGRTVAACAQQIADSRTRPPQDTEDVLIQLGRDGLIESIVALRAGIATSCWHAGREHADGYGVFNPFRI
jgi:hypothetical protein